MHVETYPVTLAPRDEEPSLSSFEGKPSEFDWLERKITRKQKYIGKTEQVLCRIYFFLSKLYKGCVFLLLLFPLEMIYIKKITKQNI